MHDKHGLLTGHIQTVLKKMTVPMMFGLFAILTFNLIDTFFISLLGTQALAAISFTFPVTFGVSCITLGIGMGLSANVGRLLGQKDDSKAASFSTHGLLLAILLVSIASTIGFLTIKPLFSALGATPPLLPLIEQYMSIWYLTIPLLVVPMAGNSVIRATGDTKTPAKIMMMSGLINGILDPLLIFGYGPFPELGIQGAAIASAISWLGGLILILHVLILREKMVARPKFANILSDWKQILKIGTPAAFSSAMNPLSGAILMWMLAGFGTEAVAAYGAAQRVESIMILVLMSLGSVLTPFIAQNMGAKNPQRSFEALFVSMRFSLIFQFGLFVLMVPLSWPIASLFSQEESVHRTLWHFLLIVPFSYGFQGLVMMLVSCLNAMHLPLKAFFWNFARLFIFTLPFAWFGSHHYGVQGLFVGIAVGNIVGGICAYGYAVYFRKQLLQQLQE
ncbi:MATE family efflux transporter [Vibrio algicola]|uniref:Multidrug resistance protein NorM n=1 Tax=Vibrio algicola TaxID=2662262 RepID=A0A5Q0TFZ1_9VIBR|nr:MATE family efflux transporter [Vibrio algicola]